ncbi:MAG: 2Fe-2S iron-sulfur cluster-binding protein [Bacteroidota bacterium]|nr:2Fe-2S iron-sulfur cluster-binding protein [Bacteroidota bacterium]
MYTIRFNFEEKGLEPIMLTHIEPGQSLLEIVLGHDIELHHNCGGVCSCTTCNLYVEKGMNHIEEISRREKDFLARVVHFRFNSRLGCQSLLLDGEGEIEITLPDQSLIPDE